METSPGPWIEALRHSHDRLQALAGPLDADQLRRQSYDTDWSIAAKMTIMTPPVEAHG